MRISESCAACLYDKQARRTHDLDYLTEVQQIINSRQENDTSPYLVYRFNLAYEKRFGKDLRFADVKQKYNDLVLRMADQLAVQIEQSRDPLETAMLLARAGNYIDFGALGEVDDDILNALLQHCTSRENDHAIYLRFLQECGKARTFLLITDNCGEIVLDRLMLEQLKKRFPDIQITILVRGSDVLNDATPEDARYAGMDRVGKVISNGKPLGGTVYDLLPDEAKSALDTADVIYAKGQGNYESLSGQGHHIFYAFLCKCALFTERFHVPALTGMFIEEVP